MATSASQPTVTPPPVEVLCATCGESLEVEPGLTEFACPYCHMAQTLPHELMPLKRKALPVTHSVDSTKIQLPCCSCSVLLNVPYGLSRFVCPQCRYEMAVDKEKLKACLPGAPSSEAMPSTPYGVRLPLVVDVKPQIQFPSYVEILDEVKQLADEATKPIREKMEEMTKSHEEMHKKMKEMIEEMKAMHQLLLAQDNRRAVHPNVIGGHAGEDWLQLG